MNVNEKYGKSMVYSIISIIGMVLMFISIWLEFIYVKIFGIKIGSLSTWEYYDAEEKLIFPILMILLLLGSIALIILKKFTIASWVSALCVIPVIMFLFDAMDNLNDFSLGIGFWFFIIGCFVSSIPLSIMQKEAKKEKKLRKQQQ